MQAVTYPTGQSFSLRVESKKPLVFAVNNGRMEHYQIKNGHWCLAIADLNKKVFQFLNPAYDNRSQINNVFEKFFKSLNQYNRYNSNCLGIIDIGRN